MSKNEMNRFEIPKTELTDFQKTFLARGTDSKVFTQDEFDSALTVAQAEIMAVAIETTKKAILIEREACADIVDKFVTTEPFSDQAKLVELIRNRIPSQRM